MSDDAAESITLRCMLQGDPAIFSVELSPNADTGKLKEAIQKKRELDSLKDIGPHSLKIWKVFLSISAGCSLLPYIFVLG
jgi:hypothetical protein